MIIVQFLSSYIINCSWWAFVAMAPEKKYYKR